MIPIQAKAFEIPLMEREVSYQSHEISASFGESKNTDGMMIFKEEPLQSCSPIQKNSPSTVSLPLNTIVSNVGRSPYHFKPFSGKQLSKSSVHSSSSHKNSVNRSVDSLTRAMSASLVLSPISGRELDSIFSGSPDRILELPSFDGAPVSMGLQVGIPEDDSRLPSPNLQVPTLHIQAHFDDEGLLTSEIHSEREIPSTLDNPFSLDISEKPLSVDHKITLQSSTANNESRDVEKLTRHKSVKSPINTSAARYSKKPQLANSSIAELRTSSSISTLGEANVVPFTVHKRVLGWKLTSVEKRQRLVDFMDAVHGHAGQHKASILGKTVSPLQKSMYESTMTALGASISLPQLNNMETLDNHKTNSGNCKVRQNVAYEEFVSRSIRSRQGFRSTQQIRNFMDDQKNKKQVREGIIAEQKRLPKLPPLVSQLHAAAYMDTPIIDYINSRSLAIRPYIAMGTLTSADKNGKSQDSETLQSLLAEALFGCDDDPASAINEPKFSSMSSAERLYNFPVNISRPRSRMDILEAVRIRNDLQPMMEDGQWKEDQLVDAFIVGRQNARLRRSREKGRDLHDSRSKTSVHTDLLGDNWDNDSMLSMSTSAEENEVALSEALMENFGLSLHDDADEMGSDSKSLEVGQSSFVESEVGANQLITPSLHPPQPLSSTSTINNQSDDSSWVD